MVSPDTKRFIIINGLFGVATVTGLVIFTRAEISREKILAANNRATIGANIGAVGTQLENQLETPRAKLNTVATSVVGLQTRVSRVETLVPPYLTKEKTIWTRTPTPTIRSNP